MRNSNCCQHVRSRARIPVQQQFCISRSLAAGGQCAAVARKFLFFPQPPPNDPDQWLKPNRGARDLRQTAKQKIVTLNVRQFVTKDGIPAFGRQSLETCGYQDDGPRHSPRDGCGNGIALPYLDTPQGLAAQPDDRLVDQLPPIAENWTTDYLPGCNRIGDRMWQETFMKRVLMLSAAVATILAGPLLAQQKATIPGVPEIPFTTVPNFLKPPPGEILGESVAVATNSKGHIFVFHHSANTRLFEFDPAGNFVKEIGSGYYGFEFSHSVRVDKDDNIWTVDEGANMITKFSPDGRVAMVLGSKPLAVLGAVAYPVGPNPPAQKYVLCRPTDVGWDTQGNIFVSDGYCNNRVVKYDRNGRFLAQAGSEKAGSGLGEFNLPHALQVDGNGHVWVADRSNNRYQELDNDLKPLKEIKNLGTGWTDCISSGPHQYIFFSNSNPNGNMPGTWDNTGEIYKAELDGTVLGKFGRPGKAAPGFQVVHMMDCRNPNEIIVGEIESWRVQKLLLKPVAAGGGSKAQ